MDKITEAERRLAGVCIKCNQEQGRLDGWSGHNWILRNAVCWNCAGQPMREFKLWIK